MESISCNLCGQTNFKEVFRTKDYLYELSDEWYSVVKCNLCDLVYVNPRPTEAEINEMYTSIYRDATPERTVGSKILHSKAQFLPTTPGKLLDVGCNKGDFLNHMRMLGWDTTGVEVPAASGNPYDLNIFFGSIWDAAFPDCHFDAVTLWGVLEHVYYPRELLTEIHRVLKPGGIVVILVTNINSPSTRWLKIDDVPRHTTLFSRATLERMLRISGFLPNRFFFHNDVFEARSEGLIEYGVRRLAGESEQEIFSDWRSPKSTKKGPSLIMRGVRRLDQIVTRFIDRISMPLGLYGIMTVKAHKPLNPTA